MVGVREISSVQFLQSQDPIESVRWGARDQFFQGADKRVLVTGVENALSCVVFESYALVVGECVFKHQRYIYTLIKIAE